MRDKRFLKIFAVSEMHRSCIPQHSSVDQTLCDTRALMILLLGLDYALTGGNCVQKRHGSLHRLFICTEAMQARQNARDFFPMKNFGAFFILHPYYRGKRYQYSLLQKKKLNDFIKGNKQGFSDLSL